MKGHSACAILKRHWMIYRSFGDEPYHRDARKLSVPFNRKYLRKPCCNLISDTAKRYLLVFSRRFCGISKIMMQSRNPRTLKYTGVAKFLGMRSSSKTTAWSVVLEFETMPQVGGEQYGIMEFLFDSAPKELSQAGAKFILIEGRIRVAEGQVIESNK